MRTFTVHLFLHQPRLLRPQATAICPPYPYQLHRYGTDLHGHRGPVRPLLLVRGGLVDEIMLLPLFQCKTPQHLMMLTTRTGVSCWFSDSICRIACVNRQDVVPTTVILLVAVKPAIPLFVCIVHCIAICNVPCTTSVKIWKFRLGALTLVSYRGLATDTCPGLHCDSMPYISLRVVDRSALGYSEF